MEITELIDALSRPAPYPHPVGGGVTVHQTHISAVFLAGPFAYKLKKPVELGFLDFSTLERRRHFCGEEVRLNRRLSPSVYHGVVAVRRSAAGLAVDAEPGDTRDGDVVDIMVRMRRLPADATLLARLRRGALDAAVLPELAERLAAFHAHADAGPEIARFGDWPTVAGNARENLRQTTSHIGLTVDGHVHRRVAELTERRLRELRPLIERRARAGVPRDTHGDLHLDHIYHFPDREPPLNLVIIDCIEFNDRFRYADPVSDMAFLAMDLIFRGRRDLAQRFADAYLGADGDADGGGRRLLPFYTAYRATVRAKVDGITAREPEIAPDEREDAVRTARAHWLLALSQLEEPAARPGLVLLGGLPGSGKSTLARGLAERAGFHVIGSDRTRKELAGLPADADAAGPFGEGIYTPEWDDRTYAALERKAAERLARGERVLVDASFRAETRRRALLDLGLAHGVPVALLTCRAPEAVIASRLEDDDRDASDADLAIYRAVADVWEPATPATLRHRDVVPTGGPHEESLRAALDILRGRGLA